MVFKTTLGKRETGLKWVFTIKYNPNGIMNRYKVGHVIAKSKVLITVRPLHQ